MAHLFHPIVLCSLAASVLTADAAPSVPGQGLVLRLDASVRESLELSADGLVDGWQGVAPGRPVTLSAVGTSRPRYLADQPWRNRPVVLFDGRNDVLADLNFAAAAETWTLFMVVAPHGNSLWSGLCTTRSRDGHDYDPGFTVDLYKSQYTFDNVSVEGAGRIGGARNQMTESHAFGTLHTVCVTRDSRVVRLWIDGREQSSREVDPAVTRMDEIRVGARFYDGSVRHFLHGEVAALLLYDRALSVAEVRQLETAYGVTPDEQHLEKEHEMDVPRERMVAPEPVRDWTAVPLFLADNPGLDLDSLPVRTDLRRAMELGVRCLNSAYNRDRADEPYFYSAFRADGTGEFLHSVNIGIPHVVGRVLLACMFAEQHAGIGFPSEGLTILERYCRSSFDYPDHLNSFVDPERENRRFVEFHNLREGLYGLTALIKGRGSVWARDKALAMVRTLDLMTGADGVWSVDLAREHGLPVDIYSGLSAPNQGRMVDPLLELFRLTGDSVALKLAGLYARVGLESSFDEHGSFQPIHISHGHIHSNTSTLSSVAAYAVLVGDDAMLERCRLALDVGIPQYFSSWGWGDEVMPEHGANEVGRGEINQTGDVIRTALLLGAAVDADYYEMAERYLRSMVLPTQHRRETLEVFMHENPEPKGDFERDVLDRTVGGYSMQLPNDRMQEGPWPLSTLDITSGAVHAMAECWASRTTTTDRYVRVNLLFDASTWDLDVRSGLPFDGRLDLTVKSRKQPAVRIPPWVDRDTVSLLVNGEERAAVWEQAYLVVASAAPGDRVAIRFDIPCRVEKETVDGREYTTTWVGSQVIAIEPRGTVSPLPF